MGAGTRLVVYAAVLALVFGGAWALGSTTGPAIGSAIASTVAAPATTGHAGHDGSPDPAPAAVPDPAAYSDGRAGTAAGYRMVLDQAAAPGELAFTVTGPDGKPVPGYVVTPERPVRVLVVRADGTGYQHLDARFGADAVWRAPLVLGAPGVYRALADLTPVGGPRLVLGTDLFVPGTGTAAATPPSRVWQAGGYQVRLDGDLVPGTASQVFATVTKDGAAVTDLEPYQGAFGHLVALRSPDLAYLHVHPSAPAAGDRAGPGVAFVADVPTAGTYRLFFDFAHAGAVRTAEFTVPTRGGS